MTADTSTAAFKRVVESGDDVILRRQVAAQLGIEPMTLHELMGVFPDRSKNAIRPRVSELIRMGCVERDGKRLNPSGNEAYVHHLTELGERYARGEADPEMGKRLSEHKRDVLKAARAYLRGGAEKDILRLAVERHDAAKRRSDPEWEGGL